MTDKGTPEWADTVVKIPRIPKDGPMPTGEAAVVSAVATKTRPALPPPPPPRTTPKEAAKAEPAEVAKPARAKADGVEAEPAKPSAQPKAPGSPDTPVRAKVKPDDKTRVRPVISPPREPGLVPGEAATPITAKVISPVAPEAEAAKPAIAVSKVPAKKSRKRSAPRRARLHISRIDPWSAMKITFMFSIAFGIMFFIAVWLSWTALETGGLFEKLNEVLDDIISNPSDTGQGWHIQDYVSSSKVLGFTALISVVNVVIMTALGTIAAFLYNLASTVIGGIEVTLTED